MTTKTTWALSKICYSPGMVRYSLAVVMLSAKIPLTEILWLGTTNQEWFFQTKFTTRNTRAPDYDSILRRMCSSPTATEVTWLCFQQNPLSKWTNPNDSTAIRDCVESGNQTVPFSVKDSSVQSQTKQAKGNQTERPMEITVPAVQEDSPALAAFLKKMEPHVYRELEKNSKTQAFQGYQVSWQEESCSVDKMHTFTHGPFEDQLQVTGLSWNCSGSVIAASYGRFDHDSWCTHKSGLCTWNIDSQSVDPRKAGKVIEQSCCLMCVAFHPTNPALICGGNFNGEIMLWDFSPNDVLLLDTCSIGDDHSHREPVAKLQWVVDPSNAKLYNLVSVSGDGKLLVWNVDTKLNTMSIMKQFAITSQSLPRTLRGKGSRLDREVGLTCLSFSHYDDNTCFTGSETGAIFKCSTERNGCGDADMISRLPLPSPVVLTYKPHLGPVNAIDCSPFHPHVFLTSGMDHSMKIWNALQMEPVKTLEPGQGSVLCGQWSPVRPMVIAATTDTGCLLLYDLQNSWVKPLHALDVASDKSPLYSLSFNSLCPNIVACGDGKGEVHILKLNDELVTAGPKEKDLLGATLNPTD